MKHCTTEKNQSHHINQKNHSLDNVPELRFPEFVKKDEWKEERLGKLANKISEKNKDGLINDVFTNSAINGIVDQREFFDKDIADKSNLENYYLVENGDYVYNPRISNIAPVGPISKNKTGKTGAMSPLYTVFRFKNQINDFYEFYFKTFHWYKAIRKASNTGSRFDRMSITDSVFMNISILSPSIDEQQKIASCLSSLDELISAHSQKLELLKNHKKGLMQNLFPQEGETVPKYRFPEFENDGDWVEDKLGKICDVRDGTHDSPKYIPNGYPLITSKNLLANGEIDFENVSYLTEDDYNQINKRSKVDIGDILFGMIGTIGNPVIVKTDGFAIKNVALIKSIGKLNKEFLLHQLKSNYILTQFEKVNAGGILKFIALGVIRNLTVIISSPKEQQKIASCLSAVDELITAQGERIEQLKLYKKGLMQGLFPKVV